MITILFTGFSMIVLLYALVPLVAFLYASVGFGGATGYLAVMSFFDMPPQLMASSALLLNIFVASISFASYTQAGHFRRNLLVPFLVTSLPASLAGGAMRIGDDTYQMLLYLALSMVAVRLLFFSRKHDEQIPVRAVPIAWALLIGLAIGLLSGLVGIGGGIFLSPVIIFARWGTAKQAAPVAAAFIVLNSISGLVGRTASGNIMLDGLTLSLIPFGVAAALAGSTIGARRLSGLAVRRVLGTVMAIAVTNFWLGYWK